MPSGTATCSPVCHPAPSSTSRTWLAALACTSRAKAASTKPKALAYRVGNNHHSVWLVVGRTKRQA
jgi:hypothetical protein